MGAALYLHIERNNIKWNKISIVYVIKRMQVTIYEVIK